MQHHTHDPSGASGGHLSLFASVGAMSFAEAYEHVRARLSAVEARAAAEQTVADAIDFLDDLDAAGTDLEPYLSGYGCNDREADGVFGSSDDEPLLGAPERHPIVGGAFDYHPERHDQRLWAEGANGDECEVEDEHGTDLDAGERDESDHEPSLGAPDRMLDQARSWAIPTASPTNVIDGELDRADAEPSLGSSMCRDQTHWAEGRNDDREDEHDGCEDRNEDHDGDCDAERSYRKHV